MKGIKHNKKLWLKHKFTAHHWRHDHRKNRVTIIAMCSCGYKARIFRKIMWRTRWRKLKYGCIFRGHDWIAEDEYFSQCSRCYECYFTEGDPVGNYR